MTAPTPPSSPDWRQLTVDAVTELAASQRHDPNLPAEAQISPPPAPEDVIIRCERVWTDVRLRNPVLNGGAMGACVAQYQRDGVLYSFFLIAACRPGETTWQQASLSGGQRPPDRRDRAGGFHLGGGFYVCVGGLGAVPEGGTIEVEFADGTTYRDQAVDSCAIVFAPARSEPGPGEQVTVRYRDATGAVLGSDVAPFGHRPPLRQGA
jgi:hypothetical protein